MRWVWRILYSLLLFLLLIMGSIVFVVIYPESVLNTRTLAWVNRQYFPEYKVEWNKINLDFSSSRLLDKSIRVVVEDACLEFEKNKICLEKLVVEGEVRLFSNPSFALKELQLTDKEIIFHLPDPKSTPTDASVSLNAIAQSIVFWLDFAKLQLPEIFSVKITNTRLIRGDQPIEIRAESNRQRIFATVKMHPLVATVDLKREGMGAPKSFFAGQMSLTTPEFKLNLNTRFDLPEDWLLHGKFNVLLTLTKVPKSLELLASPRVRFQADARVNRSALEFNFRKATVLFRRHLSSLTLDVCQLRIPLDELRQSVDVECKNLVVNSSIQKLMQGSYRQIQDSPLGVVFNLKAQVPETIDLSQDGRPLAHLQISGEDKQGELWDFSLDSDLKLVARAGQIDIEPNALSWNFAIPNFTKVVKALERTALSVPAPFNTLKGSVRLESSALVQYKEGEYQIPAELNVNLDGAAANKIKLQATGMYLHNTNSRGVSHLNVDLLIARLFLHLPKVDPIRGIPRLVADRRITKKLQKPTPRPDEKKRRFTYQLRIKSLQPDAIRIYYYLFSPYLNLDLNASLGRESGFYIQNESQNAQLNYLKRSITLQYLHLSDGHLLKDPPFRARFLYKASGYDIFLNVVGTLDKPELVLESQPTLSRENIISLLLYNRLATDITSFQKESVGGTEAAIADKTLGLLSIWAFASTPIESVSYDPAQEIYSAQIALPGGVRLNIGTDWERVNSLSFRKHLADTWVIVTSYLPGEGNEDGQSNVFIQKEIRF